jgi:hypothetical protein
MRGWLVGSTAFLLALCGDAYAQSGSEPFGQETVEVRSPRYARPKAQARPHRHVQDRAHDHAHTHPHRGHHHHDDGRVHDQRHRHPEDPHFGHVHGVETEHLFGFLSGSDVHHRGAKIGMIEIIGRFDKRDGRYQALGKKFEFAYGMTDTFNAAISLSAVRHKIDGVTGFDDVNNSLAFNGIGGEFRWNWVSRSTSPVGVTLHVEPVIQRHDELTGLRGRKYGAENKLIFDTELAKDRWFAAFNVLYEIERVLEQGETEWEKGSKLGLAFATTFRVTENVYLGFNAQYMRAYEGLTFRAFAGEAIYLGPTLYAKIGDRSFLSLAWNRQVWGSEVGNTARLDLANFERDLFRLKAGIHF